tara:strand:- start:831 stop:1385 length:555 start_codon:yes stop_codon:yes gene_type:complete
MFRKSIGGTRRDIDLGGYPDVSLQRAQTKANDVLTLIEKGIEPVTPKKTKKSELGASRLEEIIFPELAQKWINQIAIQSWKTIKQLNRPNQYLEDYIYPHSSNILVKDIEAGHCVKILKPIYRSKHPAGSGFLITLRLSSTMQSLMVCVPIKTTLKSGTDSYSKNLLRLGKFTKYSTRNQSTGV